MFCICLSSAWYIQAMNNSKPCPKLEKQLNALKEEKEKLLSSKKVKKKKMDEHLEKWNQLSNEAITQKQFAVFHKAFKGKKQLIQQLSQNK